MGNNDGQDRGTPDPIEAWDLTKAAGRYGIGRELLFFGHRSPTILRDANAHGHAQALLARMMAGQPEIQLQRRLRSR
jgi:hypothetical protein